MKPNKIKWTVELVTKTLKGAEIGDGWSALSSVSVRKFQAVAREQGMELAVTTGWQNSPASTLETGRRYTVTLTGAAEMNAAMQARMLAEQKEALQAKWIVRGYGISEVFYTGVKAAPFSTDYRAAKVYSSNWEARKVANRLGEKDWTIAVLATYEQNLSVDQILNALIGKR